MRIARPVGLSQDGRSLIVATAAGEELSIPVDDRLHAALRGDQPRLGQLEIEMDNALTPRDIQSRIRAGESLESVGRVAGLPLDRVERFAAPVLAEREHVALVAMSSSVRRRGETSGHRLLRLALTERLAQRGIDIDSVDWDAYRLADGRWSVTASYSSGEAQRQAVFLFDLRARYSVADNDEARWVLGEHSSVKGPQPGRRRPAGAEGDADSEPTLDLSDELALVRVVQPDVDLGEDEPVDDGRGAAPYGGADQQRGPDEDETSGPDQEPEAGLTEAGQAEAEQTRPAPVQRVPGVRGLHAVPDAVDEPEADERDLAEAREDEEPDGDDADRESPLETLSRMMDRGDADNAGAYRPVYFEGLSDASAAPDIDNTAWEPAIVVNYPVEPAEDDQPFDEVDPPGATAEQAPAAQQDPTPEQDATREPDPVAEQEEPTPTGSAPEDSVTEHPAEPQAAPEPETAPTEPVADPASTPAANRPAGRRKRASVPSWDEIMFGGPPRSR